MKIKTFGPVDERSLKQLERCMDAGDAEYGVLCADHHPGYSQPIGGAIAYEGYVSPSGVGYDIGCGNKAACTELTRADLDALGGVERIMREITRRISFGMGVPAQERADHPVLDKIAAAEFEPQRKLAQNAANQLGTVGSGNHYVNLMEDEQGRVWVGVHFGSRGFGHKTASGFLALAQGLPFDGRAAEGEMDSPPVLLEVGTELGDAYIEAMQLAGEYAYAGRDVVVAKVLEILGADAIHEVHNHHNFAWREEHGGRTYWVIRKGCTPARPGQEGFVGGSMGDDSVILEGVESPEAEESLFSTVHGAGRVMSRTQAAGKVRRRKRWACAHRDCDRVFDLDGISATNPAPKRGRLPGPPRLAPDEGVDRGAAQARQGRLARRPGTPARAGHRAGRRRRRRGAGGLQAPPGRARRARRLDPRQAHAAPARRGDGRSRRLRPVQGLRGRQLAAPQPFRHTFGPPWNYSTCEALSAGSTVGKPATAVASSFPDRVNAGPLSCTGLLTLVCLRAFPPGYRTRPTGGGPLLDCQGLRPAGHMAPRPRTIAVGRQGAIALLLWIRRSRQSRRC